MPNVGLLVGRDRAFADAVVRHINSADGGLRAAPLTLDGVRMAAAPGADVVLDLSSHAVPFYQSVLKNAALKGARVVNDPFWLLGVDRFVVFGIAHRLGVPAARAVLVPNREHIEGVVAESLRNRAEPLDWDGAVAYLGFPLVVRPLADVLPDRAVVAESREALAALWDASGTGQLVLEESVAWSHSVRVVVVGGEVLAMPWRPRHEALARGARPADGPIGEPLDAAAAHARRLAEALGAQLGTFDFAVRDGAATLVDWNTAAPELDPAVMAPADFAWAVGRTASLARRLAGAGPAPHYRWDALRAPA